MKKIVLEKITPMFDYILTTADKLEEDDSVGESGLSEYKKKAVEYDDMQTVIAVGQSVSCVKPGDIVTINPGRYMVQTYKDKPGSTPDQEMQLSYDFKMPLVSVGGKDCFLLRESDVSFIVDSYSIEA